MPVFFASVPGGEQRVQQRAVHHRTVDRNGIGRQATRRRTGIDLVADGQIGAVAGPQSWAMNESENTPAETTPVTKVNGVF